jgi:hypothetical protein
VTTTQQADDIVDLPHPATSTSALVLDDGSFTKIMAVAEVMAKGRATLPKHLQGNPADCMAVIMQSMQWKMNPFAVAQKTHLVNGTLGYEAQLVNAVITSLAPTEDRLHYEWFGDWTKVLGKFREGESRTKKDEDTGEPKKYRVPAWSMKDEEGLGVRVWATLRGESEPRVLELLLVQARTRNSTLWADDPRQQLAYLATKRWARLYCPDVLLGVYTPDELDEAPTRERDITPPRTAAEFAQQAKPQPAAAVDRDALLERLDKIARSNSPTEQRVADLAKAWNDIGKDGRAAVGAEEIKRLKALAAAEDAQTNTPSEQPQGEAGNPAQGAATAGPASDEDDDNPFEGAE